MPAFKFATTFQTPWQARCAAEYESYCSEVKPLLRSVTYLVFSGIFIATNDRFARYNEEMLVSYAKAFQVHQRPVKTARLHEWFMRRMPYLVYLPVVAAPVDAVVHTAQVFMGEGCHFFEGGLLFPAYLALHWFLGVGSVGPRGARVARVARRDATSTPARAQVPARLRRPPAPQK